MKLNVNTQQHDFALFLFKLPKCPECTLANQSLSFSKSPTNFDWDFGRDWSLSLSLYLYLYLYLSLSSFFFFFLLNSLSLFLLSRNAPTSTISTNHNSTALTHLCLSLILVSSFTLFHRSLSCKLVQKRWHIWIRFIHTLTSLSLSLSLFWFCFGLPS